MATRLKMLKIVVCGGIGLFLVLATVEMLGAILTSRFVNAENLGREVRTELPPGSSISRVEKFLNQGGIPFSYDRSSGTLTGTVRKVKGSTFLVVKSLQLRFQFDDSSTLSSIDSKLSYTGL